MEEWKYIEDKDNKFMVSNLGNVKSTKTDKLLSTTLRYGYKTVTLGDNKGHKIHRLVAFAFISNNDPTVKIAVDHKDGNKLNNCTNNL